MDQLNRTNADKIELTKVVKELKRQLNLKLLEKTQLEQKLKSTSEQKMNE